MSKVTITPLPSDGISYRKPAEYPQAPYKLAEPEFEALTYMQYQIKQQFKKIK